MIFNTFDGLQYGEFKDQIFKTNDRRLIQVNYNI